MPTLHHTLRLVQHDLRNLHVALRWLIERRGNHLRIHATSHISHLLRTLIDQQDNHINLRMIISDRIGNILQQHRLTRLGLRYDQTTLPLTNRREQIHYPHRNLIIYFRCLAFGQHKLLIREERSQVIEGHTIAYLLRQTTIDCIHLHQGEVFLTLFRRTNRTLHHITCLQAKQTHLRLRDINIIGRSQIVIIRRA